MKLQRQNILTATALALALVLAVGPAAGVESRGDALAAMSNLGDQVAWVSNGTAQRLALSVSGPGTHFAGEYDGSDAAVFNLFDEQGNARPDGSYTWELRAGARPVNDRVRDEANGRDSASHDEAGRAEFAGRLQWGTFTIKNGAIIDSSLVEPRSDKN